MSKRNRYHNVAKFNAMAKTPLTDRTVKALKAGKYPVEKYDGLVPGFGVRAMPAGGKSWVFVYTNGTGKRKRYTFGKVKQAAEDAGTTLSEARAEAIRIRARIDNGEDPQAEKKMKRQERALEASKTFGDLVDDYEKKYLTKKRRGDEVAAILRRRCAHWLEFPATQIRKADVIKVCDDAIAEGHERAAGRVYDSVRHLFNWAIGVQGLDMVSPCETLSPPVSPTLRDRVLSDDEIRRVWAAADALGAPFGPFVQFLLVTGQRRDEVARMEWAEIDKAGDLWIVPKERVKADRENLVPLSPLARRILETVPRYAKGRFVFTSTAGKRPVSGFSRAKTRLDRAIVEQGQADDEDYKGMRDWRLHDLRRTCRTRLAALRVPEHVAELVLNHDKKGMQAVYNQHTYLDEKRDGLERWAREIERICRGEEPAKVVALHG